MVKEIWKWEPGLVKNDDVERIRIGGWDKKTLGLTCWNC